ASIRSASVSEGGADERLQVRHRVVVREYGDDAIALGLRQDGLRLRELHEGDRSDLIALPCERELTLRQVAVALLEEGALVGGAHVGQTDREIGLQGELLLPHLVCGVVALHPRGFQAPLAREPLEDRDAQPDREAGRRALEIERKLIVTLDDRSALLVGERELRAIQRGKGVGQAGVEVVRAVTLADARRDLGLGLVYKKAGAACLACEAAPPRAD